MTQLLNILWFKISRSITTFSGDLSETINLLKYFNFCWNYWILHSLPIRTETFLIPLEKDQFFFFSWHSSLSPCSPQLRYFPSSHTNLLRGNHPYSSPEYRWGTETLLHRFRKDLNKYSGINRSETKSNWQYNRMAQSWDSRMTQSWICIVTPAFIAIIIWFWKILTYFSCTLKGGNNSF